MMKQLAGNSYLFGGNAPFVEELYEQYLVNPGAVPEGWREYFDQMQLMPGAQGNGGNHPAWERVGGDDRGQRDRTTRHRLVGPTNPGQRAFPWHPR